MGQLKRQRKDTKVITGLPTSQAAGTAHGGKQRSFHLNISDACGMGCSEIGLLVLLRVGAEGTIQTALP